MEQVGAIPVVCVSIRISIRIRKQRLEKMLSEEDTIADQKTPCLLTRHLYSRTIVSHKNIFWLDL